MFKDYARYEIINHLINNFNYKDYLEIGYQRGINYNNIQIKNKTSS